MRKTCGSISIIARGMPPSTPAGDAMLPIFLTSATTAVGVVPMIISGSSLWMPMGVVICSGTVFSMILAVIILPVFYWKIFGNK